MEMNSQRSTTRALPHWKHQSGVAILAIAVIMLLVSTLLIFAVGKSSINEQRVVGNDLRVKNSYSAAIAGVEMGHAWLDNYSVGGSIFDADTDGDGDIDADDTSNPIVVQDVDNDGVCDGNDTAFCSTVTVSLRSLTPLDAYPLVMEVISTAVMSGDTHVTKTVSAKFSVTSTLGSGGILDAPPLVVEHCMDDINGTSEVSPGPNNIGVGTILGPGVETLDDCLNEGSGGSALDLNGSLKANLNGPAINSAFAAVFGPYYTEQQLIADAADNEHIIYVDGQDGGDWPAVNNWHTDLCGPSPGDPCELPPGSNGSTYILYFDSSANCPSVNANTTIYGIVFIESGEDTDGNGKVDGAEVCANPGWGGGNVYGNVIVTGDLDHMTGGADLFYLSGDCDDGDCNALEKYPFTIEAQQIPGTWKDFSDWSY